MAWLEWSEEIGEGREGDMKAVGEKVGEEGAGKGTDGRRRRCKNQPRLPGHAEPCGCRSSMVHGSFLRVVWTATDISPVILSTEAVRTGGCAGRCVKPSSICNTRDAPRMRPGARPKSEDEGGRPSNEWKSAPLILPHLPTATAPRRS